MELDGVGVHVRHGLLGAKVTAETPAYRQRLNRKQTSVGHSLKSRGGEFKFLPESLGGAGGGGHCFLRKISRVALFWVILHFINTFFDNLLGWDPGKRWDVRQFLFQQFIWFCLTIQEWVVLGTCLSRNWN